MFTHSGNPKAMGALLDRASPCTIYSPMEVIDEIKTKNVVHVSVQPRFMPERSNPDEPLYLYSYEVTITNRGVLSCQLLRRHWVITDGLGQVQHVEGEGVIGLQPHLRAGESFTYTSFCPLSTPSGAMQGSYQMVNEAGESFEAEISAFALVQKELLN